MTPIYLDYNATTPVDPTVREAITRALADCFGNPSSSHRYGRSAAAVVQRGRERLAELIGASPEGVIFTGCATEANNLAILGAARALRSRGRHLITSAVEHPSVAHPVDRLAAEGWEITILPVDGSGRVAPAELERALRPDTVLVSVMHANNEVGTLQPIAELAAIAKTQGALFHTDAAQSIGKVAVDVTTLGVDLLTVAGHKFHAPKGIGALFVRPGVHLEPLLFGAGHEHGLRPGTENVPYVAGLGVAAELAAERLPALEPRLRRLRDSLHDTLLAAIPELRLNGHPEERLPNTLNVSFPGVSGRGLLAAVEKTVSASVGSACHEEGEAVSGVLAAMGIGPAQARGAVRLSLGNGVDEAEVKRAAEALIDGWNRVREG